MDLEQISSRPTRRLANPKLVFFFWKSSPNASHSGLENYSNLPRWILDVNIRIFLPWICLFKVIFCGLGSHGIHHHEKPPFGRIFGWNFFLSSTWRIIPFSKRIITMISFRPPKDRVSLVINGGSNPLNQLITK